jgi:hypothetical protein
MALERYIDGLQYWICANRDWSLTAMRYAKLPRVPNALPWLDVRRWQ